MSNGDLNRIANFIWGIEPEPINDMTKGDGLGDLMDYAEIEEAAA